jgi:gas vesicle protein
MSTGKVILGVLAGAAVGASLGILFAPEKGSVTRKNIAQKGVDLKDNIKGKFVGFVDNFTGNHEKVSEERSGSAKRA